MDAHENEKAPLGGGAFLKAFLRALVFDAPDGEADVGAAAEDFSQPDISTSAVGEIVDLITGVQVARTRTGNGGRPPSGCCTDLKDSELVRTSPVPDVSGWFGRESEFIGAVVCKPASCGHHGQAVIAFLDEEPAGVYTSRGYPWLTR